MILCFLPFDTLYTAEGVTSMTGKLSFISMMETS